MLVNMSKLLADAQKGDYAVGSFSVANMEMVLGVLKAAKELKAPVILQIAEVRLKQSPLEIIGPLMVAAAKSAGTPVAVHFDHGKTIEKIAQALELLLQSSQPYFRDQGKDVLLMMDSLTRFSMAQREIGLASGEPPVTRGYPPSVYSEMPKLLERAGMSDKGSITGLYTVLVDGDDFNEPITDTARSILDGHIVLSRKLGQKNHYPAIDVLQSISRCMSQIVDKKHKQMAGRMKNVMATYNEAEDLINIGAYKSGSNRNIDYAIYKIDAVNKFLMQQTDEKFDFEDEVTQLSDIFADYEAFENGSLQLKK